MSSFLEELGLSDTPYIPISLPIGVRQGKPQMLDALIRRPSGYEQDAIDAAYMNAYSSILAEKSSAKPGTVSELERIRSIYLSRPKSDIVEQVVGTRLVDVREKAAQLAGVDLEEIQNQVLDIKDDKERAAFAKAKDEELRPFVDQARKLINEEVAKEPLEDLCNQLVQANVNMQVQLSARRLVNAQVLFFTLYRKVAGTFDEPECDEKQVPKKVFLSPDAVNKELRADTIDTWTDKITEAFQKDEDLPFEKPDDQEPNGPGSLPSDSEPVSTDSEASTAETYAI